MQNPEDLAQEALKFLELAQKFEEENNTEESISNYEKAAEYLKQSGYLIHRISDIYERITELKKIQKQEKLYQKTQEQSQMGELQDQAFTLLEGAKKLEFDGFFEDAIQQYVAAIDLLSQSGWSESQLENLKLKINQLNDILKKEQSIQPIEEKELTPTEEYLQELEDKKPAVVGMFGKKVSSEKVEAIAKYRTRKKQEEEIQNNAFAHIEKAKEFEKERKFDNAIENYEKAIELLLSIGWDEQTKSIQVIIDKNKKDKEQVQYYQSQQQSVSDISTPQVTEESRVKSQSELKKARLIEFEEKKKNEESIQAAAFNLIEIGKRHDREKNYEQAIQKFEESIELLRSIEWDSYIQPIINLIEDMKIKQERAKKSKELQEKRQKDLMVLQESIYKKQKEETQKPINKIEQRKRQFEEKKEEQAKKEKNFFTLLTNADKNLQEKKYDEAIDEYQKALKIIENLGSGWETYTSNINNTILNVQKLKNSQIEKKYKDQQKIEKRQKAELEFQKQITNQLDKERERLREKEIVLKDKQKEIVHFEQRKNDAFGFLDTAADYIKKADYENAISSYQNAGNIFAEIQWNDEIPLIEKSILQVEELQRNQKILKQKRMQETIEKQKEEEAFQKQISLSLKQERERIKKKEIDVKKHEEELKYREERRQAGFKLLEQAQGEVDEGNFEKAIEILQYAANFFAGAHWQEEIKIIQDSITEIENKSREKELQKQVNLQASLEREKQEKTFQELITIELKTRQERLRQREIFIREREKELTYREEKKKEAFKLLDDAQKLISVRNYDAVIEIYYQVLNIFAQIQWKDEIPILREAIQDIENRKKEDLLFKQKELQRAVKKEVEDQAFMAQLKYQREREKAETLKNLELIETKEQITAQNLAKQQEAFKLIEGGETLFQIENYDEAINQYKDAIKILREIGWSSEYLKLLNDTIRTLQSKKVEKEREKQMEFQLKLEHQKEEEQFQKKISDYLEIEHNRLTAKQIQIQKQEEELNVMEKKKSEAFVLMDKASQFLSKGDYEQSIHNYRQAELMLNEISFPTELIKETIQKIQFKRKEEELNKLREFELSLRKQQEDLLFQQQISEKVKFEQQRMIAKQEELRKQEEMKAIAEKGKQKAFKLLEEAQAKIANGDFDDAIDLYQEAAEIFQGIHWEDEIALIQNSINTIKNKKREAEIKKQQELAEALKQEKLEEAFQNQLSQESKAQREELRKKEIVIRKQEEEIKYREGQKEHAFKLLDEAQKLLLRGQYDDALDIYHNVENIFAQIQWIDEIPIIQEAIKDIENRKREKDILLQKQLEKRIEEERENFAFIEQIKRQKELERTMAIQEMESLEKHKLTTAQYLTNQQEAMRNIEEGYNFLKENNFDIAIDKYREAIEILTKIGWTDDYLKLLYETIRTIENRKNELERATKHDAELKLKQQNEDENFQKKIYENIKVEKEKLKDKQIQIQKREKILKEMETRKSEAFDLMDNAEEIFNGGQYNQAIEIYRKAELILHEIGFPTRVVKEMIDKIQIKIKEEMIAKQKELESRLQKEREELRFQSKITESIQIDEIKLKAKQKEIEKQKESYNYMEKRRNEAFELLEEAEIYMNQAQYDKSLENYHSAELILNEIAFPTKSIREMIQKVQEKRREHQQKRQKEAELTLLKEREEWEFQQETTEQIKNERERLQLKQIQFEEMEKLKIRLETRKEDAFKILDKAEDLFKKQEYEKAIESYRKAELILNELQFPTDSIKNMVMKIKQMIKQKEDMEDLKFQRELEKVQEEKDLQFLVEERQRQEREKKRAQLLAQQEKERLVQEQTSIRESAYSLLEEAGKHLKKVSPDYERAISLYVQAKNILAENIGWEPEINNLNALIKDLQEEQTNFQERKRKEEQLLIQRQKEYDQFQEEVKLRRLEQEKIKRDQERQYRDLVLNKQRIDQTKDEGLKLIDEGKRWAAYHDFDKAYQHFKSAISKFKEIGWDEEIKYIETEIKNVKILEKKVKKEELRIQSIQEQLEKQRSLELSLREIEEAQIKQTISEVSDLASDVIKMIEDRRNVQEFDEVQKQKQIQIEAKGFRKKMGELIKIKQELIEELEKKEKEEKEFQDKLQEAKEREEIDNLKKMIKEAGKKKQK